jgi:hypothetical protein
MAVSLAANLPRFIWHPNVAAVCPVPDDEVETLQDGSQAPSKIADSLMIGDTPYDAQASAVHGRRIIIQTLHPAPEMPAKMAQISPLGRRSGCQDYGRRPRRPAVLSKRGNSAKIHPSLGFIWGIPAYERRHRIRELRLIVSASHPDALERCPV